MPRAARAVPFFEALASGAGAGPQVRLDLVPEADHLSVMPIAMLRGLHALYREEKAGN